jgi:hypothetical protein
MSLIQSVFYSPLLMWVAGQQGDGELIFLAWVLHLCRALYVCVPSNGGLWEGIKSWERSLQVGLVWSRCSLHTWLWWTPLACAIAICHQPRLLHRVETPSLLLLWDGFLMWKQLQVLGFLKAPFYLWEQHSGYCLWVEVEGCSLPTGGHTEGSEALWSGLRSQPRKEMCSSGEWDGGGLLMSATSTAAGEARAQCTFAYNCFDVVSPLFTHTHTHTHTQMHTHLGPA